ncbi:type-2 restriction enzyme [Bryobacterales bacterium F-183]|nr:type-2 restriction enzyme [Bryobacterales bacterium F-183]
METEQRLNAAVQSYWDARAKNLEKQKESGRIDAGTRGAVTGGTQMGALEVLVADILCDAGLQKVDVRTRTALELPGYYRAEKKWDLIVISEGALVLAMEFKSQVGPSFGNNFNNRSEEAIGSASCLWTAFREGRFGDAPRPFLGYLFLLEDCPEVKTPVRNKEPYFEVDPVFKGDPVERKGKTVNPGVSYSKRYELLIRRLVRENIYTAASLIMATNAHPTVISQPAEDLNFQRFEAALRGHVVTFLGSRGKS